MKNICSIIVRDALDAQNMSILELAQKVGCDPMTIHNYLDGKSKIDENLLAKILDLVGFKIIAEDKPARTPQNAKIIAYFFDVDVKNFFKG